MPSSTRSGRSQEHGMPGRARTLSPADMFLCGPAVALALVLLASLVTFQYGRDQGVFAVIAREMLEGKVLYRDAWDIKPPGIYCVYALSRALLGSSMHAIRLLEAAALL